MATKRTYQPKKLHGQKVHGFRKRMAVRSWPAAAPRAAPVCPTDPDGNATRETLEQFCQGRREFAKIPPSLEEFLRKERFQREEQERTA